MKRNILLTPALIISGVLLYFSLTNGHNWGDDYSAYIMQAKSITEGTPRGFIEANIFTVQQSSYPFGPDCYPWGFPAMLAPIYMMFGPMVFALKSVGVASFLLFVIVLWFGFRKYHSRMGLICLVGLFSLNPFLIAFSDNILSDIPFLLFSTVGVLLMGRIIVEKRPVISPVWDNIILGFSIAGAFFIRTNGVLLLISLAVTQLTAFIKKCGTLATLNNDAQNRRWTPWLSIKNLSNTGTVSFNGLFVTIIPYISFFCVNHVWNMLFPDGGSSYKSFMKDLTPYIVQQNICYYMRLPAEFFSGVPHHNLVYLISIPFCICGLIRRYLKDYHIVIYVFLTFLLYILWPQPQGLRFIFSVLPFYCSFTLTGIEEFQTGTTAPVHLFRKNLCFLPVMLVLLFFGMSSINGAYINVLGNREMSDGPFTASSLRMFEFIKRNTSEENIVVFFKPRSMRMITGRKSIMINKKEDLSRGDYVCLHLKMGAFDQVSPEAIMKQGNIQVLYANSEFRVYRVSDVIWTGHDHTSKTD